MVIRLSGLELLPKAARRPRLIAAASRRALGVKLGRQDGELSIKFLSAARMRAVNKAYLHHDYDTDVIAFGYPSPIPAMRAAPFGDICISVPMARAQARQLGHPLLTEILTLVIHGTLHLMGYDDQTPRKKAIMFRQQDRILSALSLG